MVIRKTVTDSGRSSSMTEEPARPSVTVAVCTFERPDALLRAVESLHIQDPPPDEILIVDNARDPAPLRGLLESAFPSVRLVHEPRQGLNFARNRALREAQCEIVLFLDDDAVADRHWSSTIAGVFAENPRTGVCTGRVEPLSLASSGQRLFEANGGFSRGLQRITLPQAAAGRLHGRRAPLMAWAVSVGSGNSFAVRRQLALQLGGFDEALDMGAFLPGGGDHDMLWRVLSAGWDTTYAPEAVAWHEHRADLNSAYDQIIGHQRALLAMIAKSALQARGSARVSILAFLGWRLVKPGLRLARRLSGRDPLPVRVLLRMWRHTWMGLFAYPFARREALRRRAAQESPGTGVQSSRPFAEH